jgi:hypothetical protein
MRSLKKRPSAITFPSTTITEQQHANDVDINQIMAKASRGQSSEYIREHAGHYGDATSLDFYQAQTIVANAKSLFEDLPSSIRNRFENKPGLFLDFVQDPKNAEELVELKLANPPPPEPPAPPVVPPTEPIAVPPAS